MDAAAANLLDRADAALAAAADRLGGGRADACRALRPHAAACRFHAGRTPQDRPIVAILGGTGTGKSTLMNRLLGADVSASSFRRTHTAGAVLAAADPGDLPDDWPGYAEPPRRAGAGEPARGTPERLTVVAAGGELAHALRLVDTPDLDGDTPAHHAVADRIFRWADAVVWVVTPEKYQMPELRPYYRLAGRWRVPALAVMNKADDPETVADWRQQLAELLDVPTFVVPRDDSGYRPDPDANLDALRAALTDLKPDPSALGRRLADFAGRLIDQAVAPLRRDAAEARRVAAAVRSLAPVPPQLDVAPMTKQVQKRLRDRSVLYLIGPGKIIDRLKSVPGVLARLPRTAVDFFRNEDRRAADEPPQVGEPPDFPQLTRDAMLTLQGRVGDILQTADLPEAGDGDDWRIDPDEAANATREELAAFRDWLEARWNAQPRDTALLAKLPGGPTLARATEAAPYLLTAYLATSGALFGHLDLIALGTYGAATALMERLSNEVLQRTRQTNRAITRRYDELARRQIERAARWAERRALPADELKALDQIAEKLAARGSA